LNFLNPKAKYPFIFIPHIKNPKSFMFSDVVKPPSKTSTIRIKVTAGTSTPNPKRERLLWQA
jgi:hypothetical protein